MGRNKIKIEKIKSDKIRLITLVKRQKGLLKKAIELSLLCDVEVMLSVYDKIENVFIYTTTKDYKYFNSHYIENNNIKSEHVTNTDYERLFRKVPIYKKHKSRGDSSQSVQDEYPMVKRAPKRDYSIYKSSVTDEKLTERHEYHDSKKTPLITNLQQVKVDEATQPSSLNKITKKLSLKVKIPLESKTTVQQVVLTPNIPNTNIHSNLNPNEKELHNTKVRQESVESSGGSDYDSEKSELSYPRINFEQLKSNLSEKGSIESSIFDEFARNKKLIEELEQTQLKKADNIYNFLKTQTANSFNTTFPLGVNTSAKQEEDNTMFNFQEKKQFLEHKRHRTNNKPQPQLTQPQQMNMNPLTPGNYNSYFDNKTQTPQGFCTFSPFSPEMFSGGNMKLASPMFNINPSNPYNNLLFFNNNFNNFITQGNYSKTSSKRSALASDSGISNDKDDIKVISPNKTKEDTDPLNLLNMNNPNNSLNFLPNPQHPQQPNLNMNGFPQTFYSFPMQGFQFTGGIPSNHSYSSINPQQQFYSGNQDFRGPSSLSSVSSDISKVSKASL